MTKEQFESNTSWKMTYEEYQKCDCTQCGNKDCVPVTLLGVCLSLMAV